MQFINLQAKVIQFQHFASQFIALILIQRFYFLLQRSLDLDFVLEMWEFIDILKLTENIPIIAHINLGFYEIYIDNVAQLYLEPEKIMK